YVVLHYSTYNTASAALKKLAETSPAGLKEFYVTLQSNTPNLLTYLKQQLKSGNAQMKLGMVRGLFCATGDTLYLSVINDLASQWKQETLAEGDLGLFCIL